jgi:uncharacterized membrane protein
VDHGATSGLIGAGMALGQSFQPNLLTRGTRDQAIISGATTAAAYGLFSAGDSIITSIASRISKSETPSPAARGAVALLVGGVGVGVSALLTWREHEPRGRAAGRFAGHASAAVATASLGATVAQLAKGNLGRRVSYGAAAIAGVASWAAARPWKAAPGSLMKSDLTPGIVHGDQRFFEDSVREVSPAQALGIAGGVAVATYGLARAESALTKAMSRAATVVLGGEVQDHRTAGRLTSAAISLGVAWFAVRQASALLSKGGSGVEPGLTTPPQAPEITGSPASGVDWLKQTREGARWLSMTLPPTTINAVMGISDAKQPIRVYASLDAASSDAARAQLLLDEIDRTGALTRKYFALFSPTGSGYVNYVANETFEYLTHGDCASAAIQYSVLPSALSLGDVSLGTAQTRMVLGGIVERLLQIPKTKRPKFFLFGESLGSEVSEEMFTGTWIYGLDGAGINAAVWIGTPSATTWRKQLWGDRSVTQAPEVGPGNVYLPRSIVDWRDLPEPERKAVRFLLLQNGDDPIPKFGSQVMWRKPDWLGPNSTRPLGSPSGTHWIPGTTFLMTFIDMLNALTPTPGTFAEGGHDYRDVLPDAIRETWQLKATDAQMVRVNAALRQRELAWELYRDWAAANAKSADKRAEAQASVLKKASTYTGRTIDEAELQRIIDEGLQPEPKP